MGVELQDLLKAGVHFGHQTHRWNPKMRKYIFAECGGIYLIDLKKTQRELERAHELVRETIVGGKSVLFVCTKPQLARVVRGEAERCGSFYVTERWLGGMLTNFQTIKKNIARLKELERGVEEGAFEFYTKKERLLLERERQKLDRYLSGIKEMSRLPGLVFVVDSTREDIAVREANRLGIPVVAIADTNADPDLLTIAIAGNDDAIRSVSLITRSVADVVEASRREIPEAGREEAESQAYTYSSDAGGVADAAGSSRRRRPRRKPRPEVIAQRLHHPAVIEGADGEAEPAEGDAKAAEGDAKAEDVKAEAAESDAKAEVADNPEPAADAGSEDAEAAVVGEVESEEK